MEKELILALLKKLGFQLKDNSRETYFKNYPSHSNYGIEVDFSVNSIRYGDLIELGDRTTSNFKAKENFVVLECVDRLLEKGYQPRNIKLEKIYPSGHGPAASWTFWSQRTINPLI